jgi:WD40 repeat protein
LRVDHVAWSPDGSWFASGDEHGRIALFTPDGKPAGVLLGHSRGITALAWSPDGRILASGSEDTTIRLWVIR